MKDAAYDKSSGLYKRKVSACGKYEMGIYPVMFGFRIRAGVVNDGYCNIDYCAGADLTMVILLYHCVLSIMEGRISKGEDPFKGFMFQQVKPMQNDPECFNNLLAMAQDYPTVYTTQITADELNEYRRLSFKEAGF